MAMEIGELVKQSKILLLDIEGTTTSISFVKDKLFPYAEENVKQFLDEQWENKDVKETVTALRKQALEDQEKNVEGLVQIPGEDAPKEEQIEGLVKNVKWQMSSDRKAGPLKLLQGLIWKQGYEKGDIKGHVYDDVLPALEHWRSIDGQSVHIYSSGSVQAQKLLFGQSVAGDLLAHIDGHFDTAVGGKQEAASYKAIVEKLGCKPDEILFLTDIVKEAEAARSAGLHAGLVSREGNEPLSAEATAQYPVIHSLARLGANNKRKPDTIQDEQPAKVAKTSAEDDVKTNVADVVKVNVETMEVDEGVVTDNKDKAESKDTEKEVEKDAVFEKVSNGNDGNLPNLDVEPTLKKIDEAMEEDVVKTGTDKLQTETVQDCNDNKETNGEESPAVVSSTEEIDEKESPTEVEEVVKDLEPVVEEMDNAVSDLELLKNVGDVLEKECDEILSKVQGVTNLSNIAMKPLLDSVPEEENADSNDIVESILDSELELEIKQSKESNTEVVMEEKEKIESNVQETEKQENLETKTLEDEKKGVKENNIAEESKDTIVAEDKKAEENNTTEVPSNNTVEPDSVPKETATKAEEVVKEATEEMAEPTEEPQVNGKSNGDTEKANLNGDASKEEDLKSRLSMENGKGTVNGSNAVESVGDSGDAKTEVEASDIKVKSVPIEETNTEPIEQTVQA